MNNTLSTRARRVLSYMQEVRRTGATNTLIGDTIGAGEVTVRAGISELEAAGLVTVERVKYTPECPSGRIVTLNGGQK